MTPSGTRRGLRRIRRLTAALSSPHRPTPLTRLLDSLLPLESRVPPKEGEHLRLFTLNIAHGRRNFSLLRRRAAQRNLTRLAAALRSVAPDVVALQEADGPSTWSGNFDHVATLAELAELDDFYRGRHNSFGLGRFSLDSGTALLARLPLIDPFSHRFGASWRDTKGFVVATVGIPEWGQEIDVVSVHLDFLRPAMRRKQILRMVKALGERRRPMVVLGDLNCCWRWEPRSLELLTHTLRLRAPDPAWRRPTYPAPWPRRKLDWVLVSPELRFTGYRTVEVPLSDHLGVVADLELRTA